MVKCGASEYFDKGVGLTAPLSRGIPSGSTGISDVELIVSVNTPMSGSHMLVLSSSWSSYHWSIIPHLCVSTWPVGVLNEVIWPEAQSISGLRVLDNGNPCSRLCVLIGMRSTSSSWTWAKWSILWTAIAVLGLSLACSITWQWKMPVVMCDASWGSPTLLRCCGDIKMLVAPQSMSARIRYCSQCWCRIWILWTMCDESCHAVPHRYWLEMWAFGLSETTLSLS